MARASTNAENNALNGMVLGAGGTYVGTPAYLAIFTSDPGTTGASGEVSGGSYARQPITWGTISSGGVANATSALNVPIPASTTVDYFGTFGAVAGTGTGGYQIGGALSSTITFVTAGTLTVAVGGLTIGAS